MKLTKRSVEAAEYEGGTDYRWDARLPGFGLRVYPSGRKSFVATYRVKNRKRIMVLGKFGVLTVDEARKRAQRVLADATEGKDTAQEKQDAFAHAQKASTVAELGQLYLERHSKPNKKSWKEDARRIRQRVEPALGQLLVEDLDRSHVLALYEGIRDDGKPYEANRVLALLSSMLNLAKEWAVLPAGAANVAKLPKRLKFREKTRDRPVKSDELPRLLKEISAEEDPYIRSALRLYLLTGLRKREILDALWENVDFGRKTLRLPDTKNGKPRHVPLSDAAVDVIRQLPREVGNPYLFPSPVKEGAPRANIFKPWSRIRKAAGCKDLRIHDLRHTVATMLAEDGNAAQVIKSALGHQSLQTTMKYIHAADQGSRRALDSIGTSIQELENQKVDDRFEPLQ